jgi:hypothetical protein
MLVIWKTQVVLDLAEMRANLGDCIGGASRIGVDRL